MNKLHVHLKYMYTCLERCDELCDKLCFNNVKYFGRVEEEMGGDEQVVFDKSSGNSEDEYEG